MVFGHSLRRDSRASTRSSIDDPPPDGATADDETVVDPEQGSILSHIISQLRPGADLSRVTLPTFILEPRSMLERITNFMAHPELLLPMPEIDDRVKRFVSVVRLYLSGWHIKPPGVKKPLNPILGEIFTAYWDYPDGTRGYYIAEQTSHHPPKSSYFFMAPEHHIRVDGTLKPRSKFLGNSAASLMEGIVIMRFLNRGERYFITQPNMYARGILFGKMKYELGDHCYVRCPETGLSADIEFKTKGWMSGTYDAIGGYIKDKSDKNLFELSGLWNKEMFIKDFSTGKKELLFDATNAKSTSPKTRPLEEQEPIESQKLWRKVTAALRVRDHNVATDEKTKIEDQQRAAAAKRQEEGREWTPRLFKPAPKGDEESLDWIFTANIDGKTPEEQTKQILSVIAIVPGQNLQSQGQPHKQGIEAEQRNSFGQSRGQTWPTEMSGQAPVRQVPGQSIQSLWQPHQQENLAERRNSLGQSRGQTWSQSRTFGGPPDGQLTGQTRLSHPHGLDGTAVPPAVANVDFTPKDNAGLGTLPADFQQQQPLASREGVAAGLPTRVKRQDSNTNEVEEFVDAES